MWSFWHLDDIYFFTSVLVIINHFLEKLSQLKAFFFFGIPHWAWHRRRQFAWCLAAQICALALLSAHWHFQLRTTEDRSSPFCFCLSSFFYIYLQRGFSSSFLSIRLSTSGPRLPHMLLLFSCCNKLMHLSPKITPSNCCIFYSRSATCNEERKCRNAGPLISTYEL